MGVRKLSPVSYLPSIQQLRPLHKKSHKGGHRDRGGASDSDGKRSEEVGGDEITSIDDAASLDETKERMQRVVDGIHKELSQMRSDKADAGMFDHIRFVMMRVFGFREMRVPLHLVSLQYRAWWGCTIDLCYFLLFFVLFFKIM